MSSRCRHIGCSAEIVSVVPTGRDNLNRIVVLERCSADHVLPATVREALTGSEDRFTAGGRFPPGKGQWFRTEAGAMGGCPRCGALAGVRAPVHALAADGTVRPSWTCPSGCGYHQFITLVGWTT